MNLHFDPETDLRLTRQMKAAPETVWRCWTDPELFAQWFAPKPYTVSKVNYDFEPGGRANLTMTSPDGKDIPLQGCVLLVEPARRLITTDALREGFRPAPDPFMTAEILFEPKNGGTLYTANVYHNSVEAKTRHEEMGFHEGWGIVAEQLDDLSAAL